VLVMLWLVEAGETLMVSSWAAVAGLRQQGKKEANRDQDHGLRPSGYD
jgi:hypothetical protein